jgi:hypothetical protein
MLKLRTIYQKTRIIGRTYYKRDKFVSNDLSKAIYFLSGIAEARKSFNLERYVGTYFECSSDNLGKVGDREGTQ